MQHACQDCDHQFFSPGQNGGLSPAVQCPNCESYRTQPSGIPDEQNEMLHGLDAMPHDGQDDMSGNPLQEGSLGGWQNREKRDESYTSVRHGRYSLFDSPEFETTQILAPADLYRHGLETEAAHRTGVQIPKGITDNLHAALGNLGAWVENPHENGQLRPYHDTYWKTIRPQFMKPGALQIGVADPTMAEIINHVAQTDDLTPLYQYRGQRQAGSHLAISLNPMTWGPALLGAGEVAADAVAPEVALPAEALADGAIADTSAGGVGGIVKGVAGGITPGNAGAGIARGIGGQALNSVDDVLGMGGHGAPGGGQGQGGAQPASFYARQASDEDDASPASHDEIPKHQDGDSKQQDDGNHHEWQRDISVNGVGGTDHAPSFDPGGPAMEQFKTMLPLLKHYMDTGQDGTDDPLVQALHQALEAEIPGYLDHADPEAGKQLLVLMSPDGETSTKPAAAEPEKNEPTHTDENSGGKHEAKHAALRVISAEDGGDFLPDLEVTIPALNGFRVAAPPSVLIDPQSEQEAMLHSEIWPLTKGQAERCPYCGHTNPASLGLCIHCGREIYNSPQSQSQTIARTADGPMPMPGGPPPAGPPPGAGGPPPMGAPPTPPPAPDTADNQGPVTDEQQAWFAQWLQQHGRDEEVPAMIANPQLYAKDFARARGREAPPQADDAGFSAGPPMPAQENAPPGATMPMPGMDSPQQSMSAAIARYAADAVATKCPKCHSHTTEILDAEGESHCHACGSFFKTPGKHINKLESHWALDKHASDELLPQGTLADQGQPDAPQQPQPTHAWSDESGMPLKVGQEYEMFSQKYDIPDVVRIEAVKPSSIVLTYTNSDFGLEHSDELTKKEANLEGTSFRSTTGEMGPEDAGSLEGNDDDHTGYSGSPEVTDLSAAQGQVRASILSSGVERENPSLAWLKEAGANYTPMEQRALIDETGSARNAERMSLAGTHYVTDADDDQFLFGI